MRKFLALVLSLFIMFSISPISSFAINAEGDKNGISATEETDYKNRLKRICSDRIVDFIYDDFNSNGAYEAFATTTKNISDAEYGSIIVDLWFINATDVEKIYSNMLASVTDYNQISVLKLLKSNNNKFIALSEWKQTGENAFFWYVKNNAAVFDSNASNKGICFIKNNADYEWVEGCHSTYDGSIYGTGHTWKTYYFYFDNGLKEYGGIAVSESDIKKINGGEEIINRIRELGSIKSIISRENGIININYIINDANHNITLLNSDYGLVIVEYYDWKDSEYSRSDQGGVYSTAMIPSIATYPKEINMHSLISEDGMQVVINNINLTYHRDSKIVFVVYNLENGKETKIENISVNVSNPSILKNCKVYSNGSGFEGLFKVFALFDTGRLITIEAGDSGSAFVTITNNDNGEKRNIPINVCEDDIFEYRANKVPTYEYEVFNQKEYYNGYSNGIWISDFDYSFNKKDSNWHFEMNCYNENYSCGVLEVYDENDRLICVKEIGKFESQTKGICKTAVAGYNLVKGIYNNDLLTFKSFACAKHTPLSVDVPQDGYIRICSDISISPVCAVLNGIDILFSTYKIADNLKDILTGLDSLTEETIDQIKLSVLAKLVLSEEYLKFSEKFQQKLFEQSLKGLSINMINSFASSLTLDVEDLFNDMGWSLDAMLKSALGTGVGIAEGLFEKCMGTAGLLLKSAFTAQDILDLSNQLENIHNNATGQRPFGCYTPADGIIRGVLRKNNITVESSNGFLGDAILEAYPIATVKKNTIYTSTGERFSEYKKYEIAVYGLEESNHSDEYEISMDSPYLNVVVANQMDDGEWHIINSRVDNGILTFNVKHFCAFVIQNADSVTSYTPGDINGDNAVNNKDLTRLFQKLSGWDVTVNEAALDINGDGKVNNKDLTRLFQYLSGWSVEIY